jgi:hypothetical protein
MLYLDFFRESDNGRDLKFQIGDHDEMCSEEAFPSAKKKNCKGMTGLYLFLLS